MFIETETRNETQTAKFATAAEARAIVERAKEMRGQAMRRMLHAAWARIAVRRPAGVTARMPSHMSARA